MRDASQSVSKTRVNYATSLIWLTLALLATGVEIGESIQPSRIAILVAATLMLLRGRVLGRQTPITRFFVAMAVIWLLWGITSLFWTPDVSNGIREIVGVILGFVTVVTMINLARLTPAALTMIRTGWVVAFLLTVPIAIYEIVTDQHLPHSYGQLTTGGLENAPVVYAAATFGNRNTYIAFIAIALPFILWSFHTARGWLHKAFYLATASGAASLVLIAGSRLGIAATVVELLAWFLLTFNFKRFHNIITVVVIVAVFVWGAVQISTASVLVQLRIVNAATYEDQSANMRSALYENGIQFILRTGGIGVGAGGFQKSIENGQGLYDTAGMIDPHNLFIEVLSQYGLLVGALFFGWLAYCFWIMVFGLRRNRLVAFKELGLAAKHGIILMVALPMVFLANSAFLTFTIFWMAVSCLAVISTLVWQAVRSPVQIHG